MALLRTLVSSLHVAFAVFCSVLNYFLLTCMNLSILGVMLGADGVRLNWVKSCLFCVKSYFFSSDECFFLQDYAYARTRPSYNWIVSVTMAKSIGNGFPMAAVVTTPEIARSLQHALHINTFGGNPLACTVGSIVLDVSICLPIFHREVLFSLRNRLLVNLTLCIQARWCRTLWWNCCRSLKKTAVRNLRR